MRESAKSVKYIKHWVRYGHRKEYISIGNHCIVASVRNVLNKAQNMYSDFLLKCISSNGHISANVRYISQKEEQISKFLK